MFNSLKGQHLNKKELTKYAKQEEHVMVIVVPPMIVCTKWSTDVFSSVEADVCLTAITVQGLIGFYSIQCLNSHQLRSVEFWLCPCSGRLELSGSDTQAFYFYWVSGQRRISLQRADRVRQVFPCHCNLLSAVKSSTHGGLKWDKTLCPVLMLGLTLCNMSLNLRLFF